jgi:hypothetical protein
MKMVEKQSIGIKVAYWVATVLVAFPMLSGGAIQLIGQKEAVAGMQQLGYPAYFVTILGFWKFLGGIAILVPGFRLLKEWAYAGIMFDLTGAAATNFACHAPAWHVLAPLVIAVFAIVSWALRPESRRLGELFRSKAQGQTAPSFGQ